jgi:hypothetical protein
MSPPDPDRIVPAPGACPRPPDRPACWRQQVVRTCGEGRSREDLCADGIQEQSSREPRPHQIERGVARKTCRVRARQVTMLSPADGRHPAIICPLWLRCSTLCLPLVHDPAHRAGATRTANLDSGGHGAQQQAHCKEEQGWDHRAGVCLEWGWVTFQDLGRPHGRVCAPSVPAAGALETDFRAFSTLLDISLPSAMAGREHACTSKQVDGTSSFY